MQKVQSFQGRGRKVISVAIIRDGTLLRWGGDFPLSSGPFFSLPRCVLEKAGREKIRGNIPR